MILSNKIHFNHPPAMKTEKRIRDTFTGQQDYSDLTRELASSLKFHHYKTLRKLPLEEALQTMAQVWEACNR